MKYLSKTKIIFLVLALIAGTFIFAYSKNANLQIAVKNIATSEVVKKIQNISSEFKNPLEFKNFVSKPVEPKLENSGIIYWTNINRKQNGNLPALVENSKLNQSAQNKVADMFKNQYFEHESPAGKGPGDLAVDVKYEYLSIGENLALGYFKDSEDLLTSWMNSPGHRANILNTKYTEIGVAFGKGMFKGQETWLAVQEFGRPQGSCPLINTALKGQINSLQSDIDQLQPQINSVKQQIDSSNPQSQDEYNKYNELVANYNNLVKIYNNKVDSLKIVTSQYNSQVNAYNACLGT